jgi:hypothetical protein
MNSEATPDPLVVEEDITVTTKPDALGMFRVYPHPPTVDPDQRFDLVEVCDAPELVRLLISCTPTWLSMIAGSLSQVVPTNLYHPLPNETSFLMLEWFYGSNTKSQADLDRLVKDVILTDGFNCDDLRDFNTKRALHVLDTETALLADQDGWKKASVSIAVPIRGRTVSEGDAPQFEVSGLHYRSITSIIKSTFTSAPTGSMHLTPFKQFWKQNGEDQ